MTKRILGIDLGTTYSCISYIDDAGRPAIIDNFEGQRTTPSVVHFAGSDEIVVGETAKSQSVLERDRVVQFVKRSIGDPSFFFEVDGREYKPEEVSSFILRKLANDAGQVLNEEVEDGGKKREAGYGLGRKVGEESYWSSSGRLLWHWSHAEAGLATWTQYWPDGQKKAESFWRNFHCEGPATRWDREGNVVSRMTDLLSRKTYGHLKVPRVDL